MSEASVTSLINRKEVEQSVDVNELISLTTLFYSLIVSFLVCPYNCRHIEHVNIEFKHSRENSLLLRNIFLN